MKPHSGGGPKTDADTKEMIYEGVSISQLAKIFQMDNRTVSAKLHMLVPCGKRWNSPIYQIRDAAPHLVAPHGDLEAAIKRMHHTDLPPLLQKEFWNGLRAKQQFEENEGDLWRTEDVITTLAETCKVLRMSLLLMRDRVERETQLTEKQRELIVNMIDGGLNDMNKSLIERFKNEPERTLDSKRPARINASVEYVEAEDPAEGL